MYDVILIDDEKYMLEALEKAVDWQRFNMRVAGIFESSPEAISYMKYNPVDLVITDIVMPNCNGLETIKQINSINKDANFIIISAHKSFDYVVEALRLNVLDYLLKPVDFDLLEKTIEKAKRKLMLTQIDDESNIDFFKLTDLTLNYLADNISEIDFQNSIRKFNLKIKTNNSYSCIFNIEIHELSSFLLNVWNHGIDKLYSCILYFLNSLRPNDVIFTPINAKFEKLTFLFISDKEAIINLSQFLSLMDDFKKNINNYIGIILNISISKDFNNLSDMKKTANFFVDSQKNLSQLNFDNHSIVETAISYIQKHYNNDISLSEISSAAFVTPYHFCKIFKKETGETFVNYINRIRLEEAEKLIKNTNDSISSISKQVGFNSKNHFYRLFKDFYGVTPNQYRTNL